MRIEIGIVKHGEEKMRTRERCEMLRRYGTKAKNELTITMYGRQTEGKKFSS